MSVLVLLATAKDFLRIGSGASVDTLVQDLIDGAEDWVARYCGTAFTTATLVESVTGGCLSLRPTVQPVVSVTSVTDTWTGAAIAADELRVVDHRKIHRASAGGPPWRWEDGASRFEVTAVVGYNNGDTVKPSGSVAAPAGIALAVMDLVRRAYENRGGMNWSGQGLTVSWDKLADGEILFKLQPYVLKELL